MPISNSNRSATTTDKYVGSRLKKLRKERNVSLVELADLVAVSYQQIQKYENGSNRVSVSRLWSFCEIFQVLPNYFFLGIRDKGGPRFHSDEFLNAIDGFETVRS